MRRVTMLLSVLISIAFLTAGCVSRERYDRLEQSYRSLQEGYDAAMSELDAMDREIESIRLEIEEQVAVTEKELERLQGAYGELLENLNREISQGQIEIEQIKGKLQLTVAEEIFFDSGRAELKQEGKEVLGLIGGILKKIPEKNIRVEGHTDNVRIGKSLRERYPSNWDLGAARAVNVVRYLEEEVKIDPLRLSAVSYAQYRPVASNRTKAGRARNRRIELILIERDLDLAEKMKQNL